MTARDLTGRTFGRWTVLARAARRRGQKNPAWRCRCACGTIAEVQTCQLLAGRSQSCGCRMQELARERRPWRRRNLRGRRVGDLLVLRMGPSLPSTSRYHPTGHSAWVCRCRCGREVLITTRALIDRDQPTTHCGCRRLKPAFETTRTAAVDPRPVAPVVAPIVADRVTTAQQRRTDAGDPVRVPITRVHDDEVRCTPPISSAEALRRFHDTHAPLGRVRRVFTAVDDGDDGHAADAFDPFDPRN